jgi:hypothetical protein
LDEVSCAEPESSPACRADFCQEESREFLNFRPAPRSRGVRYGFGWFLETFNGHREVFHGGTTGTCLFRLTDDGVSTIALTNLDQASGNDQAMNGEPGQILFTLGGAAWTPGPDRWHHSVAGRVP